MSKFGDIPAALAIPLGYFGDGADGAVTLAAGVVPFPAPPAVRAGDVYTLSRDAYFTDFTVGAGVTVITNGYRLYVSGTLSVAGTIQHNGGNAAANVGGIAALANTLLGGVFAGGAGGAINGNGSTSPVVTYQFGIGGGGRGGGGSGARTPGAPTNPQLPAGGARHALPELALGYTFERTIGIQPFGGGGGGGGGAGSTTAVGGGGGGGGGVVLILARAVTGAGVIRALGGNGAQGGANAGGGGGGGGGAVILLYGDGAGWTGTTPVVGGAAGPLNGTGAAGTAGQDGTSITMAIT